MTVKSIESVDPALQAAAKQAAAAEAKAAELARKKAKKAAIKPNEVKLPVFLEFMYAFSGILVVLFALCIAGVSYFSGAGFMGIVIRTGVAIIASGTIVLIIVSIVSRGVFEAAQRHAEEERKKLEESKMEDGETPEYTKEVKA